MQKGEHTGKLANFTAASGNVVYRGDNFPGQFYGMSVTPEPAGNLISARHIIEIEGQLSGREIYPQAEIVASTDERFRPVNLYTAPDGSLYIIDMYHGIIQHKKFLTTYLKKQYQARGLDQHNRNMGRIYRLRWQNAKLSAAPTMLNVPVGELVQYLAHSNGWWRDTARRLLVQSQDRAAVPAIVKLLVGSDDHKAQINALWTLAGLNGLSLSVINSGLSASHAKVVITAIALSSRLPVKDHDVVVGKLLSLADNNYEIALQVALVSGQYSSAKAFSVLKKILVKYSDKRWIKEAAISGLTGKEKRFKTYANSELSSAFITMLDSVGKPKPKRAKKLAKLVQVSFNRGRRYLLVKQLVLVAMAKMVKVYPVWGQR